MLVKIKVNNKRKSTKTKYNNIYIKLIFVLTYIKYYNKINNKYLTITNQQYPFRKYNFLLVTSLHQILYLQVKTYKKFT